MSELTLGQVRDILDQIQSGHITQEQLRVFLRKPGKPSEQKTPFGVNDLSDLLGVKNTEELQKFLQNPQAYTDRLLTQYPVEVDNGKTLAEMITASGCRTRYVPIDRINFPIIETGVAKITLEAVCWDHPISGFQAEGYLRESDMFPVRLPALLAFETTYPRVAKSFDAIVSLGSRWTYADQGGLSMVASISSSGATERTLRLSWADDQWAANTAFLATRHK